MTMSSVTSYLAFGMPGGVELIVLLVVMLLLFGSRLPSVMRNLGRGVTEFKKGVRSTEDDIRTSIDPPAIDPPANPPPFWLAMAMILANPGSLLYPLQGAPHEQYPAN